MKNPLKVLIVKRKDKTYSIVFKRSGRILMRGDGYNTKRNAKKTLASIELAFLYQDYYAYEN